MRQIDSLSILMTAAPIMPLTLGLSLLATPSQAFTFTTSSTWSNAIGGNVTFPSGLENQVRWGQFDPPSGLGFTGNSGTGSLGSILELGRLRHFNNPVGSIELTVPQTVDLTIALDLLIDNQPFSQSFTYTLRVDETDDLTLPYPYPSVLPCSDAVFWQNTVASSIFSIGGVEYTLELLGFADSPAGMPVNQFISEEFSVNQTSLYGRVVAADAVPEPTTIAGLSLAGAGLAYAHRHRKKKIK